MRILLTIFLCALGMGLAIPVSYFFQIDVMRVMSFWDYVSHFPTVQLYAASFGALQIYINTAIALIVILIILYNIVDYHKQNK